MLDWRDLESERRRAHPEIRGVRWQKSDLDYMPIAQRGLLRKVLKKTKNPITAWNLRADIMGMRDQATGFVWYDAEEAGA